MRVTFEENYSFFHLVLQPFYSKNMFSLESKPGVEADFTVFTQLFAVTSTKTVLISAVIATAIAFIPN